MDRFENDPQVQAMRRVFKAMENFDLAAQELIHLNFTDPKLKTLNKKALEIFNNQTVNLTNPILTEKSWIEYYAKAYEQAANEMGFDIDIANLMKQQIPAGAKN